MFIAILCDLIHICRLYLIHRIFLRPTLRLRVRRDYVRPIKARITTTRILREDLVPTYKGKSTLYIQHASQHVA